MSLQNDWGSEGRIREVGLIAGSGQFPLLFAHAARQASVRVFAIGFDGETDPTLSKYVDELHMLKLGQLNRLVKTFRSAGITHAAMAGAINKTRMYAKIRPDWRAVRFINKLRNRKDDSLLRALADELESEGILIQPSTIFLPELLAPEGILTRRKPNRREQADIGFGWTLAKAIGRLDIGQCLVVKNQAVLAVEGIDGTDATIMRGGRLCREGAVIVKVSKPMQDMRFDVPAAGADTIEVMKRVNARVLVLEAGKTLLFDRERTIDAADSAGISILVRGESAEANEHQDDDALAVLESNLPGPRLLYAASPQQDNRAASRAVLVRTPRPDAIRTAVIGVGYLGRFHAQKYARLAEADLVGIVDIDGRRAEEVATEVRTSSFTDYRQLIGKVDAVSIVTPTPQHFAIAREFLSAGVHVLLEKPMTKSREEADELIAIAAKNGAVLQVGHLERFNSAFTAIRNRLSNPMFVEADRLALFNERGLEVDVILDLMIHDIDIVMSIIQAPLKNVHASGIAVLSRLPDIATVRMEFENGAVANLTASRISIKSMRKLRIFQENCYFSADYFEKRAYAVYKEAEPGEDGFPQISLENFEIVEKDALEEEIFSFMQAVRTGSRPEVDGEAGRRALSVALEISSLIEEQMRAERVLPERGNWKYL
ncbi:MAG: UDP-2,3-diacylglucosamine diphosphatase LpxI [Syntrophobacteraceae bacterium]|nr:UDP-2,3-diacylglucosamine diphosphatase LpxI [Syntrophobacteraceae bacterium]